MAYNVAITGNLEVFKDDFDLLELLIFVRTTNLINGDSEDNELVYHLSSQPHFKDFNKHFINLLNSNGIRWRYFKHSFFNRNNRRGASHNSIFIITSNVTSLEDMALMDMVNLNKTKDFDINVESIVLNDSLTRATKYATIIDRYTMGNVIQLAENETKTLF